MTYLSQPVVFLTILLAVGLLAFAPLPVKEQTSVPHAEAAYSVVEVGANKAFNLKTSIESTISAVKNTITAIATMDLRIKEYILDRIAWLVAKLQLQKMSADILQWVNSGFGGDPAFVTDLNEFILGVGDVTAERFIESDRWRVACEPFEEDIEYALTKNVRERDLNDVVPSCTFDESGGDIEAMLQGDFRQGGGWESWFKLVSEPQNTPYGAYLAAEQELQDTIFKSQLAEQKLLEFGDGFLSDTYCYSEGDCIITTPGEIIKDITERQLDVGTDALLEADELNEVLASLLQQLAQEAITGVNGLLGLGGGSGSNYSDLSSGYLDELRTATTSTPFNSGNPIDQSISEAQILVDFYNKVLATVDDLEQEIAAAEAQYPSCFNVTTNSLDPYVQTATAELAELEPIMAQLQDLSARYDAAVAADDTAEQQAVIEEYQQMLAEGLSFRLSESTRVQVETEPAFDDAVAALRQQINQRINFCEQQSGTGSGSQR